MFTMFYRQLRLNNLPTVMQLEVAELKSHLDSCFFLLPHHHLQYTNRGVLKHSGLCPH